MIKAQWIGRGRGSPLLEQEGWPRHQTISPKASLKGADGVVSPRMTTPSALSKVASRHLFDAQPPLLSEEGTTFRFLPLTLTGISYSLPGTGYWCISLLLGPKMSDVGMSHVRCPMYLSNDPKTKCDIWLSGHVTNTSDIVHGTSQHLTLHEQQSNDPLLWDRRGGRSSSLPCAYLLRPDPILVRVIAIRNFEGKSAVGVAFPSAAEIDGVVYSSNLVVAADAKADRIVLAVTYIGKTDAPQNRSVEGAGRTKSIDAKCVVPAVFARPFTVVDQPRRNFPQRKIHHGVRTNHHRIGSTFQLLDDSPQHGFVVVQIVRVELNAVTPAVSGINGLIPAAANSEITPFGNEMDEPGIRDAPQNLRRPIRGVVVDDDDVETKIRLLVENTVNGVENGLLTVSNWYDHTGLERKVLSNGRNRLEARLEISTVRFRYAVAICSISI